MGTKRKVNVADSTYAFAFDQSVPIDSRITHVDMLLREQCKKHGESFAAIGALHVIKGRLLQQKDDRRTP